MANKEATLLLKIKEAGGEVLDGIASKFGALKEIGLAAFGAISAIVVKSIADYRQQEEATNALSRAMINQGIYSKALKDDYVKQAEQLQKLTTYGDEQIIGAQAVLQGYLGQLKVAPELTKATIDLAAAKKMDLASAAEIVGKTIGTETNALARNGVQVDATASKQEKLAQVLTGINSKWAGQSEAAASGLGILTQLGNVLSDLFEKIGQRLAPVIILFSSKLKQVGTDASIVNPILDAFLGTLHLLTNAGVIVGGVFEALGKVLGTGLAAAISSVSALISGDFAKAFDLAKLGAEESGAAITDTYTATAERLKEVDAAYLAGKQENLAAEREMEAESNTNRSIVAQEQRDAENSKKLEDMIAQQELEMEMISANEEAKEMAQLNARIKAQQNIIKTEGDAQKKLAAQNELFRLNEEKKEMLAEENRKKNRASTLATISTLQQSNNKELAAIGKAAAITQIAIETPVAIARALSAFPPPFSFVAAGLVGTAMAVQAAQIAGVPLAEGGIVMPRPGGTQATIGEAGQAEAVIPLDRASEFGLGGGGGGTVVINVYGGMLGNDSDAREFAVAVDRELLKLRQNNESTAFDSGVV